ncbi:MAG: zinc transporter ZupT [Spirochaetes bacterium]|nr:zinc transporter ZupT [Spirochaetota bacterium]
MDGQAILFAFALTIAAGLSTGIGSAISVLAHHTNKKFLSIALGFSAGVMIYVSFVEILAESRTLLSDILGAGKAGWVAVASFFAGISAIGIIDRLVPEVENPHEMRMIEDMCDEGCHEKRLLRLGILSAFAIAIHNFPEGIVTFITSISDPSLGVIIALAIAIHNIPEGIAVAVPIYFATGSRKKAFLYSFVSGFAEPLGAVIAYGIMLIFFNKLLVGILMGIVAGIMVFISLDELLPTAREYGEHHLSIFGLIAGMAVMAVSLIPAAREYGEPHHAIYGLVFGMLVMAISLLAM